MLRAKARVMGRASEVASSAVGMQTVSGLTLATRSLARKPRSAPEGNIATSFCRAVWAATFSAAATRCTSRNPSEDPARSSAHDIVGMQGLLYIWCSFLPRFRNSTSKTNDLNTCSEHHSAAMSKRNGGFGKHHTVPDMTRTAETPLCVTVHHE